MNIPLNIDWQQILLHLFNFALLAGGLYLLLYKPVKDFMAKREAYYQELADQAAKNLEEAEQIKLDMDTRREHLEEELLREKSERAKETQEMVQHQLEDAKEEAERIVTEAQRTAQRTREKAMEDARDEIKQLVINATERVALHPGENTFDQFLKLAEEEIRND